MKKKKKYRNFQTNALYPAKYENEAKKGRAKERKNVIKLSFFLTLSLLCGLAWLIGTQCSMVHQFQLRQTQIQSPRNAYSVPKKS